mmetsp:Transcript_5611/g.7956  ORF Transcript_5611/g.7956 Transcript_5611/m.7956 type:complete len:617 (-) Transcript_5611:282-2132(-)
MLTFTATARDAAVSELRNILRNIPMHSWHEDIAVSHALQVRQALSLGNYATFFSLYASVPNMGQYILDTFVDKVRIQAAAKILKAYKLTMPLSSLQRLLGLSIHDDDDDDDDSDNDDELYEDDDDYDDDDDDIFASYHTTPPKTGEQYQEERQRLINIHQAESQDFSKKREAYFKSEEYLKQGDQSRLAGLRAQHSSFIRAVGTDYPPADGNTLAAVLVEAVRASIEKANSAEGVDAFPCPVLEQRDALKGKQFGHHAIRGQDIRGHYTKQKRRGPFGVGFKAERFECGMGAFDIIEASGFCCPNCFKLVPSFDFLRLNYGGYEYDRIYEIATSRDAIDGSVFRDTAELLGSNTKMAKMVRGILRIGTEAENERVPKDLLSVHKERCTCKTPRNWNKNPTSILVAVKQDKTLYTEFGTETPAATSPSRPPRTVQESIARPDYVLPKPDARMYLGVKKDHNRWHVEVKSRGKKLKVEIFTDLDNAIKFYDDLNRKKGCYNFLNRPTDEDYESLMDNKRIGLHDHSSRPEDLYYKNISKCESSNKYRVQLSKFGQPLYRSKERYDSQKEAAEAADVIIRSQIEDGYARWRQLNFPQLHEFKMPLTHYAPAKGFESYKK